MKRCILGVLVLVLLLVGGTAVSGRARAYSYSEYAARYWASAYGLNQDWFWRIALCESGGNSVAYNTSSGAYGLYQFMPATYYFLRDRGLMADVSLAPYLNRPDPEYRTMDADAGAAEAHVAAWAFYRGYGYLWACRG